MKSTDDQVPVTSLGSVDTIDVPAELRGVGALTAGQVIDHYTVGDRIGAGGVGEVYRAVDATLERTVAIKIMRPNVERDRLLAEAQALAKLSHPNVVVVHEAGIVDGRVYIAMEFVEGTTLRTWLTPGRTWREIVAIYLAAGRGVVALHDAGLVHRDFKPDNVLVGADGRPRVADLGLAARASEETPHHGGTPRYMAPEQHDAVVDARSDQYAFAVSLAEALESRTVPTWIRAALDRGMQDKPDDRWPSLADLLAELERDPGARRRRIAVAIGGLALAGAAVAGGLDRRGGNAADACDAAAMQIVHAWSAFDPMVIRARFIATKRGHAPTTAGLVQARLDQYANGWRDQRREVCLATSRHEQTDKTAELRVRCLDRLAGELRALTDIFERDADAPMVDHSVSAVGQLTPVDTCASSAALADIPPPTPAQAGRVDSLRKAHDVSVAAYRAGQYKQSLASAHEQLTQARALGYPPSIAESAFELAQFESALKDDASAERDLTDAVTAAGPAHDDATTNDAWRALIDLATAHQKFDIATERMVFARAASSRSGSRPIVDALLDVSEANLSYGMGDYPHALGSVDGALDRISHANLATDHRATALNVRARILHQMHRDAEGLVAMQEAEQIWEHEFGPDHPNVAGALVNLSTAEGGLKHFDAAKRDLDRAIALTEAIFGPESLNLARALNNRCGTNFNLHAIDAAKADCDRALTLKTKLEGPTSADLANTLITLAAIAELNDDMATGLKLRERMLAIHLEAYGENHPRVVQDLYDLGSVAQTVHDYPASRAYFERGLRAATAVHEATLIADGALDLAGLESVTGHHAEARARIRSAIAGHEALDKAHHTPLTTSALAMDHKVAAEIERDAANLQAAEVEARHAVALIEPVAGAGQSDLAQPLDVLARILIDEGNHHEAIAVARKSLAITEATHGSESQRARLYSELGQALWGDGDHAGGLAAAQTARAIYAKLPASPEIATSRAELDAWLASRHRI